MWWCVNAASNSDSLNDRSANRADLPDPPSAASNGLSQRPSHRSRSRQLDRGLGWADGSAARALSGGVPTADGSNAGTANGPSQAGTVVLPVAVVATMLRATRSLNAVIGGEIDVAALGAAQRAAN